MDSRVEAEMNVGKARIHLKAEGCIDCGTPWSHAWEVAKTLTVRIGERVFYLDIHRCGDCMPKERQEAFDFQTDDDGNNRCTSWEEL
jgi:hypothetical protein